VVSIAGRVMITATRIGNLYIVRDKNRNKLTSHALTSNNSKTDVDAKKLEQGMVKKRMCLNELKLMHERYGHVSYAKLMNIITHNSVDGVDSALKGELLRECAKELLESECEGCLKGKMSRLGAIELSTS